MPASLAHESATSAVGRGGPELVDVGDQVDVDDEATAADLYAGDVPGPEKLVQDALADRQLRRGVDDGVQQPTGRSLTECPVRRWSLSWPERQ
ncbi:hypothetical protein [Blastococcus mobilis]|uniref:hypothetical protein n=1 Tax=Blastococcus mobilis TaxID=1938746 RepID=UPI000B78169B|nr:hypothetical protein [Blastococcus mobilis]